MIRKLLVGGGLVLIVAVAAGLVPGVGPVVGYVASDGGATSTPSPRPAGGTAADRAASTSPFTLAVDRVERCGRTCRDVTTSLTNRQSETATDVTVSTRIYVGNGTEGEAVWEGTEPVGSLDPGETHTATERVDLSLTDAFAVKRNDGWITVRTTVTSDAETVTVTQRRRVL